MNKYLKGIGSLLDIYATQRPELNIEKPSWDDFSALQSDWEKVSDDFKHSVLKYIVEIAQLKNPEALDNLITGLKEYLIKLDAVHKLLSELQTKPNQKIKDVLKQNNKLLTDFQRNMALQKELLEKIELKFKYERRTFKEKASE